MTSTPPIAAPSKVSWSVLPWLAFLMTGALALVWFYAQSETQLSLYDEWTYIDYLDKVSRWEVPNPGEVVDVYTMRLSSCRGVIGYGNIGAPCGGPYDTSLEPYGGRTTGGIHGPVYFALTAAAAHVLMALGITSDLLVSGRIVGGLWLGAGLVAFVVLAREVGAARGAALGMAAVLALLPITQWTNAFVTPDAGNFLMGSLVVWSTVLWERQRFHPLIPALSAALATAIKAQNVLVVLAAVSFVGLRVLLPLRSPSGRSKRSAVLLIALMLLAAALPVVLWAGYQAYAGVGEYPDQGVGGPFSLGLLVRDTTSLLLPAVIGPSPLGSSPAAQAAGWLLIAGGLGALVYRGWEERTTQLMASLLLVFIVGGPILMMSNQFVHGVFVPSSARYAGSLLPGVAAVAAVSLRSVLSRTWLTAVAAWLATEAALDRISI